MHLISQVHTGSWLAHQFISTFSPSRNFLEKELILNQRYIPHLNSDSANVFLILGIFDLLKPLVQVLQPSEVICIRFEAVKVLGATRGQYWEDCTGLQVSIGGDPIVNPEGFKCSESISTIYFSCRCFYWAVFSIWAFYKNKDEAIWGLCICGWFILQNKFVLMC